MANYYEMTRTNYFKITDSDKFKEICEEITSETGVEFDVTEKDGKLYGCISSESIIMLNDEDETADIESFYKKLQTVLEEDDAIIFTSIGHEKLSYLVGMITVITKDDIQYINLEDKAMELARTMLKNPEWNTVNSY